MLKNSKTHCGIIHKEHEPLLQETIRHMPDLTIVHNLTIIITNKIAQLYFKPFVLSTKIMPTVQNNLYNMSE